MSTAAPRSGLFSSLRSRVVAISVVPSLVLLVAGLGAGWWLAGEAQQQQATAAAAGREVGALRAFLGAVLDERRAAVIDEPGQAAARTRTDTAAADLRAAVADSGSLTDGVKPSFAQARGVLDALAPARQVVRSGARGLDAAAAYDRVVLPIATALDRLAPDTADDAGVTAGFAAASRLVAAAENAHRTALAVAASRGRVLDTVTYPAFAAAAGDLAPTFDQTFAAMPAGRERDALVALLGSDDWNRATAAVNRTLEAGPAVPTRPTGQASDRDAPPPPVADPDVDAATAIATRADGIAFDAASAAADRAATAARSLLTATMIGVLALIAVAALCMVVAVRTASGLGRRLGVLREATAGAAERLPGLLDRIRGGETVDVDAEIPHTGSARDELGHVAALVESAQRTAVGAAAQEARTRAGANAVFLNIAHRSQAVVHRQLQVLDEAERAEHNSDQLARLFQLDHLATRERRNAENLIIMGGQQPRRQWRKPVPLTEIVRSAVSESEQYTRITFDEMPDEHVDGAAVGDLIHLFAELVDNATSFSPPRCPIDVQAGRVGRGVVVEIQDRGLGIEPEPRERLNHMLANPPDFGLLTLSEDSRLGLFVVGRLAHRHGIRVTLRESPYGGVQALVLVPQALLVEPMPDPELPATPELPAVRELSAPAATNGHAPPLPHRPTEETGADPEEVPDLPVRDTRDEASADPVPAADGPADQGATANRASGSTPPDEAPRTAGAPRPRPGRIAPPEAVPDAQPVTRPLPVRAAGEPPALPEREPQEHLAAQLREDPAPAAGESAAEPSARRSSAAMSALQRRSRDGRASAPEDRP